MVSSGLDDGNFLNSSVSSAEIGLMGDPLKFRTNMALSDYRIYISIDLLSRNFDEIVPERFDR